MAFAQPIPRAFNVRGILTYAPAEPGVFGITNSQQWLYVAAAEDMRAALLELAAGGDPNLNEADPTGFVVEICPVSSLAERRDRLVAEYNPVRQRRDAGVERRSTP